MRTYLIGTDVLGALIQAPRADARSFMRTRSCLDVIVSPLLVISSPLNHSASQRFEGGIAKVTVSGGERHERYLSPDTVMYLHPNTVTVLMGNGKSVKLTAVQALTVIGGKATFDMIAGDTGDDSIDDMLGHLFGDDGMLVDCVERGNAFSRIGDITDTATDYDTGERLAIQMNQVFNALGRPKEFEAQAEAIWAAYEKKKAGIWWTQTDKFMNATAMKQIGIDAAKFTADLQRAYPKQLAFVPSDNIPKPSTSWWDRFTIPWWGWTLGGVAVVGLVAGTVLPIVLPVIAARRMAGGSK